MPITEEEIAREALIAASQGGIAKAQALIDRLPPESPQRAKLVEGLYHLLTYLHSQVKKAPLNVTVARQIGPQELAQAKALLDQLPPERRTATASRPIHNIGQGSVLTSPGTPTAKTEERELVATAIPFLLLHSDGPHHGRLSCGFSPAKMQLFSFGQDAADVLYLGACDREYPGEPSNDAMRELHECSNALKPRDREFSRVRVATNYVSSGEYLGGWSIAASKHALLARWLPKKGGMSWGMAQKALSQVELVAWDEERGRELKTLIGAGYRSFNDDLHHYQSLAVRAIADGLAGRQEEHQTETDKVVYNLFRMPGQVDSLREVWHSWWMQRGITPKKRDNDTEVNELGWPLPAAPKLPLAKTVQCAQRLQHLNLSIALSTQSEPNWSDNNVASLQEILNDVAGETFEHEALGSLFAIQLSFALRQLHVPVECSQCREPANSLNFSKVGNYSAWRWRFVHSGPGERTNHGPLDNDAKIAKHGSPWFPATRLLHKSA